MGVISNGTTLLDAGALDSGVATGAMTLIKTITASSDSTISFVHGSSSVVFDGTYKKYIIRLIQVHCSGDNQILQMGFRDGSSSYDATKISTYFASQHKEDGSGGAVAYNADQDQTLSTGYLNISEALGADNDQCTNGTITIYDPANTTFVKHFIARMTYNHQNDREMDAHIAGFCLVSAAIDAIQFKMDSGNIDSGTFKLYGIK